MKIKLVKTELIHFVGIGGIGMNGLALIMKELGFKIQGSDISFNKNIERLKIELEKFAEQEAKARTNLESMSNQLNKLTLKFELKAGEEGKLFGSITSQMIADAIIKKGFNVDKKEIEIPESIKTEGNHFVDVKLDKGFSGRVKIKVKGI